MTVRVHQWERLRGVHPRMLVLPHEWQAHGTFDIVVAMHGGLRVDEGVQSMLSGGGMSAANALIKTPHGRGGAVDLYPLGFLTYVPPSFGGTAKRWGTWEEVSPIVKAQFAELGAFSKKRGFAWGGDWVGKAYPNGDQPHHELRDWRRLPFPAPVYAWPAEIVFT